MKYKISFLVVCVLLLSTVCCVYESSMPTNEDMNLTNYIVLDNNITRVIENRKDVNISWSKSTLVSGDVNESTYAYDKLACNNVYNSCATS